MYHAMSAVRGRRRPNKGAYRQTVEAGWKTEREEPGLLIKTLRGQDSGQENVFQGTVGPDKANMVNRRQK